MAFVPPPSPARHLGGSPDLNEAAGKIAIPQPELGELGPRSHLRRRPRYVTGNSRRWGVMGGAEILHKLALDSASQVIGGIKGGKGDECQ